MSRNRYKLNVSHMMVIDTSGSYNIPIVIVGEFGNVLYMTDVAKVNDYYLTRQMLISEIDNLIKEYDVDTIVFEENKLFVDKIDKYPDPYILRDVMLGFGVQVSIEDKYYDKLILVSLPEYEWKKCVLGRKFRYSIDLYKSHVLSRYDVPIKYLEDIRKNNYYKAICLSESILFDSLMHKKYQINKGD